MKHKNKKILPMLLALAVMLSMMFLAACSISGGTANAASAQAGIASGGNTVSAVSLSSASDTDELSFVTDAFSNRDVSGEYDADEAVGIDLNDKNGEDVVISEAGTYILTGTLTNGSIIIDATSEDKVQLVLNGATVCSDTYAAIYVRQADKVFITLADGTENRLENGGSFIQRDDNNVDGVIFSKDDLTINGLGSLTIVSPGGHGIVCKDELVITGGTIGITAGAHGIQAKDSIAVSDGSITIRCGKDGLHAENDDDDTLGTILITGGSISISAADDAIHATSILRIDGGEFDLSAAEGLEATLIILNDGSITISASDDGINAARKSSAYTPTVEINGGSLDITMGRGDTDAIDSNGNLVITGGTVVITGSGFDYDGSVSFTGGTVILNGQEVTSITNSMMGGMQGPSGSAGFGGKGRR